MKQTPKWRKDLTKTEVKHLVVTMGDTRAAFKRNLLGHADMYKETEEVPCWDCYFIAKKLGIQVDGYPPRKEGE